MEIVASGLGFPEGPVACSDGSVILVETKSGNLTRVFPDGRYEIIAELGDGPNGAAIGPDSAVYVCNSGGFEWSATDGFDLPGHAPPEYSGGSIQRVDPTSGKVDTIYQECNGRPLRGPNDIVFDSTGGFWFTDLGKTVGENWFIGAIYYAAADGSRITCAKDGLLSPNGIGLSPNEDRLHVADTRSGRLWTYEIAAPGILRDPPSRWAPGKCFSFPGYQNLDSLAVEAGGNVCVATLISGTITTVSNGEILSSLDIEGDKMVTNICFGGDDMRDAWITSSGTGRLLKMRWPRPGLRLAFNL